MLLTKVREHPVATFFLPFWKLTLSSYPRAITTSQMIPNYSKLTRLIR